MYGDYPEELVPEPNTEADVRAYYFLERNDGEILDTLSPEQISQCITDAPKDILIKIIRSKY